MNKKVSSIVCVVLLFFMCGLVRASDCDINSPIAIEADASSTLITLHGYKDVEVADCVVGSLRVEDAFKYWLEEMRYICRRGEFRDSSHILEYFGTFAEEDESGELDYFWGRLLYQSYCSQDERLLVTRDYKKAAFYLAHAVNKQKYADEKPEWVTLGYKMLTLMYLRGGDELPQSLAQAYLYALPLAEKEPWWFSTIKLRVAFLDRFHSFKRASKGISARLRAGGVGLGVTQE